VSPAWMSLVLAAAVSAVPAAAEPDAERRVSPGERCEALTGRFQIAPMLRPILADMCRKAPTFRRQVVRLAQQPGLAVSVDPGLFSPGGRARASTAIGWVDGALQTAEVRVPPGASLLIVELVAHEFEHVVEQIDGVNLTRWIGRAGVWRIGGTDGPIETERARRIGRIVALEFASAGAETTARRVR
jgi:hypothetical protein